MEQLEDPLGAAVTLSNLLSTNEDLLRKFVSPDLIRDFARMISDLGPQERLINFLEAICDVEGRPIKSNQEMILRLVTFHVLFENTIDKISSKASMGTLVGQTKMDQRWY